MINLKENDNEVLEVKYLENANFKKLFYIIKELNEDNIDVILNFNKSQYHNVTVTLKGNNGNGMCQRDIRFRDIDEVAEWLDHATKIAYGFVNLYKASRESINNV